MNGQNNIPSLGDTGYYVTVDDLGEPRVVAVTYRLAPVEGWYELGPDGPAGDALEPGEWFDPASLVYLIRQPRGGFLR